MAEKNKCGQDCVQLSEIDVFIDKLEQQGSLEGKLIAILHKAQEILGYLPEEVQSHIARRLSLPPAKVYGVVSFYSYFSMIPKGKYVINVCMGTACFVVGADKILEEFEKQLGIKAGQTTPDRQFSLYALRCVGACGLAPVVVINEKMHGKVTLKDVSRIIDEYKEGDGR
ncbi:MAG: NAD(P)H-dependent oxidoreductase subunit E [Oscillospiraceae bacterium]|nr:NAD(P)H-dependent oxidoreductase subunit E [Oscillospiraceae bacterium]